ncbi:MAG: hypothetical protein ACRC3B_23080 [Bacteroidia bacterium]
MSCIIYIYTDRDIVLLCREIKEHIFNDAVQNDNILSFDGGGLIIFENKYDVKPASEIIFPKEYYCFNRYIDYHEEFDVQKQQMNINRLLRFFWERNIPAVAEGCDDFSPEKDGGYNRKDVPWPN